MLLGIETVGMDFFPISKLATLQMIVMLFSYKLGSFKVWTHAKKDDKVYVKIIWCLEAEF